MDDGWPVAEAEPEPVVVEVHGNGNVAEPVVVGDGHREELTEGQRMDAQGNRAPATRKLLNRIETPDGPDVHQIVLHLNEPEPVMLSWLSTNQNEAVIRSKAVWDKAGGELVDFEPNEAGIQEMQNNPSGTGPYQFEEFVPEQYIRYAPLEYEHWRITPNFPDLQIFFVREAATHLAMLVTEEAHAADVPRDLQPGGEARGFKVISRPPRRCACWPSSAASTCPMTRPTTRIPPYPTPRFARR